MKKFILLILFFNITLFAFIVEVKEGDINVTIDNKKRELKKGKKIKITGNSLFCILDGKGKVDIYNNSHIKIYTNLNSKNKDCIKLYEKKGFATIFNKLKSIFIYNPEKLVFGISRKSIYVSNIKTTIFVNEKAKNIIIKSRSWELPATMKVYNTKGKVVLQKTNHNNTLTYFTIPSKSYKNKYKIEITNDFGEKMFEGVIKIIKN